jgi:hypothetical protein
LLIISNNVRTLGMEYPTDAVIRVNIAWIKDREDLINVLDSLKDKKVYLDFPLNRTKFPLPKLDIAEVIEIAKAFNNIIYFAFSNAEETNFIKLLRQATPTWMKLVPKIETVIGVSKLDAIVKSAETDIVMLDREDLASDCLKNNYDTQKIVDHFNKIAQELNIKVLNLKGVIFSD